MIEDENRLLRASQWRGRLAEKGRHGEERSHLNYFGMYKTILIEERQPTWLVD